MSVLLAHGIFAYRPRYLPWGVLIKPQSSAATLELRLCRWGRYQKKRTPSKLKVKYSSCHSKTYLYLFLQRKYGFEPDWYLWFYTTWLSMCSCAGFWLMPAGIFLGRGQKWHRDITPRRQYEQHSSSLKSEGEEHFPCHFFFPQGLPPSLSLLEWV